MENQNDTAENQTESDNIIHETSSNKTKTWIYPIACILLFAVEVVFLTCFLDQEGRFLSPIHYREIIVFSTIAAILITVWCLLKTLIKITVFNYVTLIIAGIMLAVNWYIYFRYIPKYGPRDGCAIVKADPKYASATVEPEYYRAYNNGKLIISTNVTYEIEDNPFYKTGYVLDVISDGKMIAWIWFDSATGKYESYELKDNEVYEPED
jgi:hypothetical protein